MTRTFMPQFMMRAGPTLVAVLLLASAAQQAMAEPVEAGKVTFLKGNATMTRLTMAQADTARSHTDTWKKLNSGDNLREGDIIKTGTRSRIELTLKDGSIVRLGSDSRLRLARIAVNKVNKRKKKISIKLFIGRLWTNVTSIFGSSSKFEVETDNAVAGVRGTVFRVSRRQGKGTRVHVYKGNVLVSNMPIYAVKGHTRTSRVQVSGPQEIAKKQWEEMITKALEQVHIAEAGEMTRPAPFNPEEDAKDEWVAWNKQMDKGQK